MPTPESEHHVLGETTLMLDGLPIQVTITDWLTYADRFRVYHFEFRSPDGKPNTLSPTGYQSHHLTTESVLDFAELETYARDYCRSRSALRDADPNQLSLFDSNRDRKSQRRFEVTDETPPESLIIAHLQAIRSDINNLKLTVQDLAQQVIRVRKHLVSMDSE